MGTSRNNTAVMAIRNIIFVICLTVAISNCNGKFFVPAEGRQNDLFSSFGNFIQGIINSFVDLFGGRSSSSSSDKVNCQFSSWSSCSKTCSKGFQYRTISKGAENGGETCSGANIQECALACCAGDGTCNV